VVGIPLVAEAFATEQRAKVLGIMMTGAAFGNLIAGQVFATVGPYGWRYVMYAGVLPAVRLAAAAAGHGGTGTFQGRPGTPPRTEGGTLRQRRG